MVNGEWGMGTECCVPGACPAPWLSDADLSTVLGNEDREPDECVGPERCPASTFPPGVDRAEMSSDPCRSRNRPDNSPHATAIYTARLTSCLYWPTGDINVYPWTSRMIFSILRPYST